MILRRGAAAAAAVVMVVGAIAIRERVIEDTSPDDGPPSTRNTVVCASELRDVCRDLAIDGVTVRIADVDSTLDELSAASSDPPLWLTFDPFPAMVDELRRIGGVGAVEHRDLELASSRLAAVARADDAGDLAERCGDPVDLVCVGRATDLSPTFAPLDTGIGTLGVAAAVAAYGADRIALQDLDLLTWARQFRRAGATSLSGTAVQTIQVRPTFAVAIGAEAELAEARRQDFAVLYADPMSWIDVVLMVPSGTEPPGGLTDAVSDRLLAAGWEASDPARQGGLPSAGTVLAIRDFWEQL